MLIINRFIQIADKFQSNRIELNEVFSDASESDIDQVLEALYVIANRRMDFGDPIQLDEIATAIPDLLSDESVLEVAVEISIDGLVATGNQATYGPDELVAQLREVHDAYAGSGHTATSRRLVQPPKDSAEQRLPRAFGPPGIDGAPRYDLRRVLGSGNQGTVFEAVDQVFSDGQLPVYVALKTFYDDSVGTKLLSEGKLARRIRHRNVASVTDQGITEHGSVYVVYELIDGQPLDEWVKLKGDALRVRQICKIMLGICEGVQAAHASGIVHRDLKPSNILIDRDSRPVITDFGIASTKNIDPSLSANYGTRGSLAFMAPEQYEGGEGSRAPLVDVYALGGLMYWLLSTRFPNGDRVAEAIDWLENHEQGGPFRDSASIQDPRLRGVVNKAIMLDPSERYQSAEAFAQAIRNYVDHHPIDGIDTGVSTKVWLFAKRKPAFLAVYILALGIIAVAASSYMSSQYQQRMNIQALEHQASVSELNHQIEVSKVYADGLENRVDTARGMIESWSKTLRASDQENAVMLNLLFLHSQSLNTALSEDPMFFKELIERKAQVARDYVEQLDPATTSPIQMALWHELIGNWIKDSDPVESVAHSREAVRLIELYAPEDELWARAIRSTLPQPQYEGY